MNPHIAANQQRLFLEFFAELRPHLRRDSALPRRLKELLARHRAIGSRDRKLYRELLYTAIRFLPWVEPALAATPPLGARIVAWLAPELKPTAHYRAALCSDWPAVPATLADKAAVLTGWLAASSTPTAASPDSPVPAPGFIPEALLPAWFRPHCPAAFASPHLEALNRRAGVWVRLQCADRALVLDEFRALGWNVTADAALPDALALPPNAEVAGTDAYRRGFVEIQDLGSQLVLAQAAPEPGTRWLDACAGAGGKTLQLARLLGPGGHVDATDIRAEILEELRDRGRRARLTNITITAQPAAAYDGVLVDAPCSGTGTWRRQPHLKWSVQPETVVTLAAVQREILAAHAGRVRPGGRLVYATCSLSHVENRDVVAAFLAAQPGYRAEAPARHRGGEFDGLGTTLLPGTRDTDGFYVALLRRRA